MLVDAGLDIKEQKVQFKNYTNPADGKEAVPVEVKYIDYYVKPTNRRPLFDEILVRDTSRFARNVGLLEDVLEKLKRKHVYVNFIDIGKTTRDDGDLSFIRFVQTMDEQFIRDLSRKVRQGNERSIANKTLRGSGKTYGFTYTKRKNLQENNKHDAIPHEALVVQKIYRLYAGCMSPDTNTEGFIGCDFDCSSCTIKRTAGIGTRQIANYLAANNIKTRAKKDFNKRSVDNILQNEKLAGYINTGKYDTGIIFKNKTHPKVKDEYMIEPDPENIEAIVSMDLFMICKDVRKSRLTSNNKGKAPSKSTYGGGILRCAKCGSNYLSNIDRGRVFYQCSLKKTQGLKACTSANVFEDYIDSYLGLMMSGGLSIYRLSHLQSTILDAYNAASRRLSFIRRNRDNDKVQELQEQEASLNTTLKGLYKDRHLDKVNLGVLEELIEETEADLDIVEKELIRYTKKPLQFLEEVEDILSEVEPYLTDLEHLFDNLKTTTYTVEELVDHLSYLTIYGETNPTGGGGKPADVNIIPTLEPNKILQSVLSVDEPDLKTYPPIKMKANENKILIIDEDSKATTRTLTTKEDKALQTNPQNVSIFPITSLKDTFKVLSEDLEALQSLYY